MYDDHSHKSSIGGFKKTYIFRLKTVITDEVYASPLSVCKYQ